MRTCTRTTTCTRTEMLVLLVRVAVHRVADDPERILRRVLEPGIEQRLLRRLTFLALDEEGLCHARLLLSVNWNEHRRLNAVQSQLSLPVQPEEAAPELREMLASFERAVERDHLRVCVRVGLCPGVDVEHARKILGLAASRSTEWAGTPVSASLSVKKLPELELLLELADEEE